MKNLSINSKLILLSVLPLLSMLIYAGMNAAGDYQRWRELSTTKALMSLATSLGDLTHALQVERGSTVGFIQSGGARFAADLPSYRKQVDQDLAKVRTQYAAAQQDGLPASVSKQVDAALESLAMLNAARAEADRLAIPAREMAARYTSVIGEIQDVIPEIGEQGRGFAVVADEVRKLAERTTRSTEEIAAMIGKIQGGTKQAIESLEVGVERVNKEVALAQQAGSSIQQIQAGTGQVGLAVDGITSAIREQSAASTEIARQVEKVAQMSEEISAATQTNTQTAQEMKSLAQSLQGMVAQFKV